MSNYLPDGSSISSFLPDRSSVSSRVEALAESPAAQALSGLAETVSETLPSLSDVAPSALSDYLSTSDQTSVIFFSAWFCPFAQRAQIALEAKQVAYEYVECAIYEEGTSSTKIALPLEEKKRRNPEFVKCSPLGLVPALHDRSRDARVHDSHVCVSYVDEAFVGPPLLPDDPLKRARLRGAIQHFDEKVRPAFYAILMRQDKEGRQKAAADLTAGWAALAERMDPAGPYFCGEQFSIFECATLPWFQRIESVLGHYRGYSLPREAMGGAAFERLKLWYAACLANPAFAKTICNRERLINNYSGYADNSADNAVSAQVRASSWGLGGGKAAAPSSASAARGQEADGSKIERELERLRQQAADEFAAAAEEKEAAAVRLREAQEAYEQRRQQQLSKTRQRGGGMLPFLAMAAAGTAVALLKVQQAKS